MAIADAAAAVTEDAASQTNDSSRGAAEAPRLVGLSTAPLAVAPIRFAVGVLGIAGAILRGLAVNAATAEFIFGTAVFAFAALADPRRHFFRLESEAEPVPADATFEPLGRVALLATYPSTVGLTVLTGIALAINAALAAVLAGGAAGLGVAGAVAGAQIAMRERASGIRLYLERGGSRLFAREAAAPPPSAKQHQY
ncbi:MAG: hypothetical protein QOK32_445 [Gaiellaceae bacterium]|nr:hypothetical protein [Gaiellaceae bacterium]